MRTFHARIACPLLACAGILFAGCNGEDSMQPMSTLKLNITDAPLSTATKVWLQFTAVEVKAVGSSAQTFTFSAPKGFDLLTLQNGNAATLLGDTAVPAGEYEWVRLHLDPAVGSSYVIDTMGQHNLIIPSGADTGLKLVRGFTMPAGGRADFTIDFLLQKSIHAPPGQAPNYMMKPVLRMTDNIQVGTIAGAFLTATPPPVCPTGSPTMYLYPGSGVIPDDIYNPLDGSVDTAPAVDPLVTTSSALNGAGKYAFNFSFVTTGTYTLAYTCDLDDPAVDENAAPAVPQTFVVYPQPVVVVAGQTTTANF